MTEEKDKTGKKTKKSHNKGRNKAEWGSLIISFLIVSIFVGLLTYQYFAKGHDPVNISITIKSDEIRNDGNKYYVPVEVKNTGDKTAEDLRVKITHTQENKRSESELQISFLAGGETAKGTVVFKEDPRAGEMQEDVISYLEP